MTRLAALLSLGSKPRTPAGPAGRVVVVTHGSRNGAWVDMLRAWFEGVRRRIVERTGGGVPVDLAFLEVAKPSLAGHLADLASRRRERRAAVAIFPFFLSRSLHAGEDVPAIAREALGARRPWRMIAPQGLEAMLAANAVRRLADLGATSRDAVVVCGYGSSRFMSRWRAMIADIQREAGPWRDAPPWTFVPCGHFLGDNTARLRAALSDLSAAPGPPPHVVVLPLFLGIASYQKKMIPGVITEFNGALDILFRPDAVLPDPRIEAWAAESILADLEAHSICPESPS